jgi:hypothetical protein
MPTPSWSAISPRRPRQRAQKRRGQKDHRADPLEAVGRAHQARAGLERPVAVAVLQRVADLVGRRRHGGQRAAVQIPPRQAHRLVARVVVVAQVGHLDLDPGQATLVQQVARQLAAGAGKIRSVVAVPGQHGARPEGGTEDHGEDGDADDYVTHGREYSRLPPTKGKGPGRRRVTRRPGPRTPGYSGCAG